MTLSKIFRIGIVLSVLMITLTGYAQKSKVERNIVKAVDKHNDESIELLKKAISINSGTMNFDGVKKIGQLSKYRHSPSQLLFFYKENNKLTIITTFCD